MDSAVLFKTEGASLELKIVNYEFPADGGDPSSDDRNWLVLRCTWVKGDGAVVKDSNSCLLTYELRELAAAFDCFETVDPALVPKDSLLREFIGGGSYHYK